MSSATMDLDEFHKTNDMALVAYLRVVGHTEQDFYFEGGTAYWMFRIVDSLMDDIDAYYADEAVCNPRLYNSKFAIVKRDFYARKGQ